MEKLIKRLEKAIEMHTHLYYTNPEKAERYTETVYALSDELSQLGLGYVYCRTASGKLAWFNLETYQFN